MQSDFNPETYVADKDKGDYVTRLTLKANDNQPRIGVYFSKVSHALLSMFHPSVQNWLVVNNLDPDTNLEIHLDTFYLRKPVNIKYQLANSKFQRLISAGADLQALEKAAIADCQILGYDAMTVKYPVHFNLQFLRDEGAVPVNFEDLDGFIWGTMFCQPEDVLVHVESSKINMMKFLQAIRQSVSRQMRKYTAFNDYDKNSVIGMRIGGDIHEANLDDPFLQRTFITEPEEISSQQRYVVIPPTPNINPFTDLRYPIPREVIRLIALNLSLEDILNNCLTSKQFNVAICDDDAFWREKLRFDYPQREAMKSPDLSWKEFYQAVVGRDGLLGVRSGYTSLQLIGVLGFLSNIVVILRNESPFNFLAGRYDAMINATPGLEQILPRLRNITAAAIWLRATDHELSKALINFGPLRPEKEHFKHDEPNKYMPLTDFGKYLDDRMLNFWLDYIRGLVEYSLPQYPWVLNLTKSQIDDYLEAFLVSPEDDFTVQLRVMKDYRGYPIRWKDILDARTAQGLIQDIVPGNELLGKHSLYSEYKEGEKVYDDWSIRIIIELIRKKLQLTLAGLTVLLG